MSISITVRHSNGKTENQNINADGAIDTKQEAEDALAFASQDGDTVDAGGKTYSRQDLIDLRDKKENSPKLDINQLVSLNGEGGIGLGKWSHDSGGFEMAYARRLWSNDTSPVSVWGKAGGAVNVNNWDFETPGGESANSHFTRGGLALGASIDVNPKKAPKLHVGIGPNVSVSGFGSPESTLIETPTECVPGDLGQQECEPGAGPQTGNAGTTGVYNPDGHNSEGDSGVALTGGLNLSLGVDVSSSEKGGIRLFFFTESRATYISDRHPFGFMGLIFGGGVAATFGKVKEAPKPAAPESLPSTAPATQPSDAIKAVVAPGDAFQLGAPDGGWQPGDQVFVNGAQVIDPAVPTSGTDPYKVPADKLTNDPTIIEIRRGGSVLKKYEVRINSGSAFGVIPPKSPDGKPIAIIRPTPQPGVAAGPLSMGMAEVTKNVPKGSVLAVYVDGNEVGKVELQPKAPGTDHTTPVTIPASVADGPHQVGLRLQIPGQEEVRYNDQPVTVGPSVATLSAASVTSVAKPDKAGKIYYSSSPISLSVTTDRAPMKARVTIGTYIQDVPLTVKGSNTVTLSGAPSSWATGGAPGKDATFTVSIQPLNDTTGAPEGTSVSAGSVTIRAAKVVVHKNNPPPPPPVNSGAPGGKSTKK